MVNVRKPAALVPISTHGDTTWQTCLVVPTLDGNYRYCERNMDQATYTVDDPASGSGVWQGKVVTPHLKDVKPVYALQLERLLASDHADD